MANIKFSQFTVGSDYTAITDLVGYSGSSNIRITPDDLISTWNGEQQIVRFSNALSGGASSEFAIGSVSNSNTKLNLDSGASAGFSINGLNAVSLDSSIWTFGSPTGGAFQGDLKMGNIGGIPRNEFSNGKLWVGDGTNISSELKLNNDPSLGVSKILFASPFTPGTQQFLEYDSSVTPRPDFIIGEPSAGITFRSIIEFDYTLNVNADLKDAGGSSGTNGAVLTSNGGSNNGIAWRKQQPGCQIKIVGGAGLANTNNGADFLVPYNTVVVNDSTGIFNPVVTGGFGNQGAIQVLQSGRYEFFARYSSFDLAQTSLPTLDGNKFFRITAATDTVASGIGTKQCILQDLVVATSVNGEANVTGGGFMDLNAGDYFKIIGFHNGATGGSGSQGFPVSSNAFFNEPMLWLVKIQ
jgi:hypothetical protein